MLSQQWLQDPARTLIDKSNLSGAVSSIIAPASQPDILLEIMNPMAVNSMGYATTMDGCGTTTSLLSNLLM